MIVDTSALVAIATGEPGWEKLRNAIDGLRSAIPAPVLTEFHIVTTGRNLLYPGVGEALIGELVSDGVDIIAFDHRHADITAAARDRYGRDNGRGGLLNFGDLMVYAVAKQRGEPVLCTGRDFAATDLDIHPASRLSP